MKSFGRIAILMGPATIWLVLLLLIPLLGMLLLTFRHDSFGGSTSLTLENYATFLAGSSFHRLLLRSIWIALLVSMASILLAYPLAYFLALQAGEMRLTYLTALIIPAWTSYLLRVLSWKIILGSNGVLNNLLQSVGGIGEPIPLLLYNPIAVIITLVYAWVPFVALPIFASLERIERNLYDAAADLGAPPWETFLRVTLPLSMPGVLAGFLYVFIPTVGEYITPALVGGPQGIMYGNIILDKFLHGLDWPTGSIMSLAMLLAVLLPILFFSRVIRISELAGLE